MSEEFKQDKIFVEKKEGYRILAEQHINITKIRNALEKDFKVIEAIDKENEDRIFILETKAIKERRIN